MNSETSVRAACFEWCGREPTQVLPCLTRTQASFIPKSFRPRHSTGKIVSNPAKKYPEKNELLGILQILIQRGSKDPSGSTQELVSALFVLLYKHKALRITQNQWAQRRYLGPRMKNSSLKLQNLRFRPTGKKPFLVRTCVARSCIKSSLIHAEMLLTPPCERKNCEQSRKNTPKKTNCWNYFKFGLKGVQGPTRIDRNDESHDSWSFVLVALLPQWCEILSGGV